MRDLGAASRFTAGALGQPGSRRFFLEIDAAGDRYHYVLEKQQVTALVEQGKRLLLSAGLTVPDDIPPGFDLDLSAEPIFRVGDIAMSLDVGAATVTFALIPTGEESEPVQFDADLKLIAGMIRAGETAVAAGRPLCPRCSLPMDPDHHICPASNGDLRHRR